MKYSHSLCVREINTSWCSMNLSFVMCVVYLLKKIFWNIALNNHLCVHWRVYHNIFQRKMIITFVINHQYYTIIKYFCREQWRSRVTCKKPCNMEEEKYPWNSLFSARNCMIWSFKKIWNLQILKTVRQNFEYTHMPSMYMAW